MGGLLLATGFALWAFFHALAWVLAQMPEPIGPRAEMLRAGAQTTLLLTLVAGSIGLVLGVLLGLGKLSRVPLVRWPVSALVWVVQGTPLLVQVMFVYYALPTIHPAFRLDEFAAGALALAINVGAYNAEVIRAGIQAVPKGQTEAARSLGLSGLQTMRFIVLPQAIQIVIPPLVNNVVALLKDSSLVSVIGLLELTLAGDRIRSETFQPVPVLITAAAVYLVLTTVLTLVTRVLERALRSSR